MTVIKAPPDICAPVMGFRTGNKPAMSFAPESKISAGLELLELVNLMPARIEVDKMESLVNE